MDEVKLIEIKEDIQADNRLVAENLRQEMSRQKTFLINLMSSPGSGKTSTIISTVEALKGDLSFAVIEADIDSKLDAEKVAARGIKAVQLKTGGFCHLDASMVSKGLQEVDFARFDVVIIENVGNLVCPAEFDTGAIMNAMILSVPEGDDKPLKYPLMFSVCDVLLINKIDYLEFSDFDMLAVKQRVLGLNPRIRIYEISAKTGEGIDVWASWLKQTVDRFVRS
ncbi:MAG: hydrogenase nickel incorporation protein HypB [Deltaproteobacteria bacterium]|nr:hydrogenase nickel incorporation protein HypB [Deltaproteobacteria bacterium]